LGVGCGVGRGNAHVKVEAINEALDGEASKGLAVASRAGEAGCGRRWRRASRSGSDRAGGDGLDGKLDETGTGRKTEDELGEGVTTDTTVVVAINEELGEGVTVETTVVVATGEERGDEDGTGTGVKIEDELGEGAAVDVTTWVVVETGAGLEDAGTGVKIEDELGEGVTTETTVVVATDGLGAGDELGLTVDVTTWVVVVKGVADVIGQELMVCVMGLVTGNVAVAVLVWVDVAEAEVTVVVAAGTTAAVAVRVAVLVIVTVVEATVAAAGDVPKVAVNARGVCANKLRKT
jgi:hypothetical protein